MATRTGRDTPSRSVARTASRCSGPARAERTRSLLANAVERDGLASRRIGSPGSGASTSPGVLDLVDAHTSGRDLGFLGERGVNVLELNLALDQLAAAS